MANMVTTMKLMGWQAKNKLRKLWTNERGEANIIAIILVLAIVIALAIIFRNQLMGLFNKIWGSLFGQVDGALGEATPAE